MQVRYKSTFDVLGVNVSATNLQEAVNFLVNCIDTKLKTYVCVAPVSTIVDCNKDENYRKIVNNAGMVTPDGMPVVWIGQRKVGVHVKRTYGPDLLRTFMENTKTKKYKHFFYGSDLSTLQLLVENLRKISSELKCDYFSPGKIDIDTIEEDVILKKINDFKPDILWIGLGSPKQDFWMSNHRALLDVPVMVGVGAAFDFVAGVKNQAPKWIQKSGLEWVFRLCSEPKRLWKRYLLGNPRFIYLLIKEKLSRK